MRPRGIALTRHRDASRGRDAEWGGNVGLIVLVDMRWCYQQGMSFRV